MIMTIICRIAIFLGVAIFLGCDTSMNNTTLGSQPNFRPVISYASVFLNPETMQIHSNVIAVLAQDKIEFYEHVRGQTTISVKDIDYSRAVHLLEPLVEVYRKQLRYPFIFDGKEMEIDADRCNSSQSQNNQ